MQAEVNKVYGSIDFSQSEPFFEAYHELTGCPADGSPQPFFNNGPQQPSPGVNANVKNPEEASEVAELCNEDYFQAFNLTKLNDPHYIYAGLPCPAGFNQCTSQKCVKRYLENQVRTRMRSCGCDPQVSIASIHSLTNHAILSCIVPHPHYAGRLPCNSRHLFRRQPLQYRQRLHVELGAQPPCVQAHCRPVGL